jgi:LysR family transcriptional regulator, hca operon transcriptional activator
MVAVLPAGHRLAARKVIRPQDIAGEPYITSTRAAPVLKTVIDAYAAKVGITLKPRYEAENLSSAMSLVASTGGVTLLPLYAQNLLSSCVESHTCADAQHASDCENPRCAAAPAPRQAGRGAA